MICRLTKYGFTSKQGFADRVDQRCRPIVVVVVVVTYSYDESRIRNALHRGEYPLRDERSGGPPLMAPTWRKNFCLPVLAFALSSCSRTSRPTGTPVFREVSLSQVRSSSVRRIVSV